MSKLRHSSSSRDDLKEPVWTPEVARGTDDEPVLVNIQSIQHFDVLQEEHNSSPMRCGSGGPLYLQIEKVCTPTRRVDLEDLFKTQRKGGKFQYSSKERGVQTC